MAKQIINIGTNANDGTGDPIRDAFDKVNDNFTELYTDDAGDVNSITATAPIVRDSATGAVTISLANAGVTLAKVQNVAANSLLVRDANSSGVLTEKALATTQILIGDGTGMTAAALSGDATMTNAGVVSIGADKVITDKILNSNVTTAKIANDAVTADKLANSINSEITANTAKTGITSGQASAITANTAKTGITSGQTSAITANTAKVTNATHTGDVTGATALTIGDNKVITAKILNDNVTHDKLEGRYTALQTITTTSGTINLAAQTYAAFNFTGNVATATFNIQNIKKGQVIDILLSGTNSSAVITLADDFSTSAINKVGTTELDQSAKNIIQVLCVDDTDNAAILTYAIATFAVDTTP